MVACTQLIHHKQCSDVNSLVHNLLPTDFSLFNAVIFKDDFYSF